MMQGPLQESCSHSLHLEVAAMSDVGRRRSNNEDCFGYDLKAGLFIVCDGMGGMACGELASSLAVERALDVFGSLPCAGMPIEERLHKAIEAANETVWNTASGAAGFKGMGTTLVAACIENGRIVIGNVGDSRGYFLRGEGCIQITEDHSIRAEQLRMSQAEMPQDIVVQVSQYITRAVGVEVHVRPDYYEAELLPGDAIVLATDGLTRYVDEARLASTVQAHASAERACCALLAIADEAGAVDNVTCMVILVN